MIEYLIRSGLVLTILLAVYRLWLEKEKMHHFNRFYLLFSLFLGLVTPLIDIKLPETDISVTSLPLKDLVIPGFSQVVPPAVNTNSISWYSDFPVIIYCLVALFLLTRFVVNLYRITRAATVNPKRNTPEGTIVLIKEKLAPHSFLFFTFLNQDDYLNQRIEQEIITHEFAHVRQKHSVDLLLVELLMVMFWFNPIFIFYKKAMQLNHEFLADEAVIESSCNVSVYQQLLLQKATLQSVKLASNFNFSVTKKRFKMMKKQTSKTWRLVKVLSLIPVAAMVIISFSDQTFAQGTSATPELRISLDNSAQLSKDEYYKGAYMRYINSAGKTIRKRYEELTAEEKNYYPAPVQPTEELMSAWKDAQKFVVLINFEKIKEPLENYKAKDFISYYSFKSDTQPFTYIQLVERDFLEKIKRLGGDFNREGNLVALTPPPPVIIPAKKN
jgi:hypothetical protein